MYARKPFADKTASKYKYSEPVWHDVEQRNIYKGTTHIDIVCGPKFKVDGITQIKDKIPDGGRRCGTCRNLKDGKDSTLRRWSSTGLSTKQV